MTFSAVELNELPHVISEPRFATYLQASHNQKVAALALYEWNLAMAAAFVVPLQICEVAVRNGVAEALEQVHGANWPWSDGFIRSLPVPRDRRHYNPGLDLRRTAERMPTVGKVVAELKFAFWEKIFTAGQDRRIWAPHLHACFPGIQKSIPIASARAKAFDAIRHIRELRNRIAHHEPIFARYRDGIPAVT